MKKPNQIFSVILTVVLLSSLPLLARALANSTYVVDRLTDANPDGGGVGTGLSGDLRYAMTNAHSGDSITFSVTGTIILEGSLPAVNQNISIEGPGQLTVDGVGASVFSIGGGKTVVISNLSITGGVGNGGGIFNSGTLTLNNVTVRGNIAGDPTNGGGTGAGIWNYINGTLILNNSTISGNTVLGSSFYNPSRGGGIANYGTLTLNNSTVSGNSAIDGSGGGISNTLPSSILTLNNSTLSNNSVTGAVAIGGGIDNRGALNAVNTIVAGNTGSQAPDLSGTLNSLGHNLIGNATGGSGFRPDLGDLLNVNPMLSTLQNNGGPTETMALVIGSPAIDTGDDATCAATPINNLDQRGVTRPQGSHCDIGSFEGIVSSVNTVTVTSTPSVTYTPTQTATDTPTSNPTDTATNTATNTATSTSTDAPSDTATSSPTDTATDTPTNTPNNPATGSPTNLPTDTPINTLTPTPFSNTPGKVTGGGAIGSSDEEVEDDHENDDDDDEVEDQGIMATFGFTINYEEGDSEPKGNLTYQDHKTNLRLKATSFNLLVIEGNHAWFTGTGMLNDWQVVNFTVVVDSLSQLGSGDMFYISIPAMNDYTAGGTLTGGHITIHNK